MSRWLERDSKLKAREAAFERAAPGRPRSGSRATHWRRLAQSLLEESYALRTIQTRQGRHVDQS